MKWSARLGTIAGIDIYVHATFALILIWVGLIYWAETGTIGGVITGLALILALFGCVVMHEYGHALTARRYGIGTKHITLLPIGGVAMLEGMPREPMQEVRVALAGPAVNVVIAVVLGVVVALGPGVDTDTALTGGFWAFVQSLLAANIFLAVFNMIPAFPMDGGRVLRALLSIRMDRVRATRAAGTVGQALAIVFALYGLMGNPVLVLIALFVWVGATAEAGQAEVDERLARQPVSRAMITDFDTLGPDATLGEAVDLTLAGTQKDFPVIEGDRIRGIVTQTGILKGLRADGEDGRIADVLEEVHTTDIRSTLPDLMEELRGGGARTICVLRDGRLVGLVDMENLSEFVRFQQALAEERADRRRAP